MIHIVICGSFKRDFPGLRRTYKTLVELGCNVLSPANINPVAESQGFVYMAGQEQCDPADIEANHLRSIEQANWIWLHAPEGYVGHSGILEIGYAASLGVPVYCDIEPTEAVLRPFVRVCLSPEHAFNLYTLSGSTPQPAIRAYQEYYKRVSTERGYDGENIQNSMMLMLEELGELAKAIRKKQGLVRHGNRPITCNEAEELADVFLFVLHIANILAVDLAAAVQSKERVNWRRFLSEKNEIPATEEVA